MDFRLHVDNFMKFCSVLVFFVYITRALHGVGNPYGYGYGVDFGWIWIFFSEKFGVEWVMG